MQGNLAGGRPRHNIPVPWLLESELQALNPFVTSAVLRLTRLVCSTRFVSLFLTLHPPGTVPVA